MYIVQGVNEGYFVHMLLVSIILFNGVERMIHPRT